MARKRRKMTLISNSREAIKALGGDMIVAEWLGVNIGRLVMIKHRGYIPRGFHLHFYLTLTERGFQIAPELFGLQTFNVLRMPVQQKHRRVA